MSPFFICVHKFLLFYCVCMKKYLQVYSIFCTSRRNHSFGCKQ